MSAVIFKSVGQLRGPFLVESSDVLLIASGIR